MKNIWSKIEAAIMYISSYEELWDYKKRQFSSCLTARKDIEFLSHRFVSSGETRTERWTNTVENNYKQ